MPQGSNGGVLRPAYAVCDQFYFQNGKALRESSNGNGGPVGPSGLKGCMDWAGNFHVKQGYISNWNFSDERLKKNIINLDSKKSLDRINAPQGKFWVERWRQTKFKHLLHNK